MNIRFEQASFITSEAVMNKLPPPSVPEVAFAGRSNGGKSSAINTLCGQKKLAKTSGTPGKTRLFNLFDLEGRGIIMDLPGYGYAKVSAREQKRWGYELTSYILERESLRGLVIVMDIRHPMTDLDEMMLALAEEGGRSAHILLTKSDKLKRGAQASAKEKVKRRLRELDLGVSVTFQTFSSLKNEGVKELKQALNAWYTED